VSFYAVQHPIAVNQNSGHDNKRLLFRLGDSSLIKVNEPHGITPIQRDDRKAARPLPETGGGSGKYNMLILFIPIKPALDAFFTNRPED